MAGSSGARATWLYVIAETESGPTKVGVAQHVGRRASGIQSGNPRELTVHAQYRLASRQDALDLESMVLGQFRMRGMVLRGEWVKASPEQVCSTVAFVLGELGETVDRHAPEPYRPRQAEMH